MSHQGSVVRDLRYLVKWVYTGNLRGGSSELLLRVGSTFENWHALDPPHKYRMVKLTKKDVLVGDRPYRSSITVSNSFKKNQKQAGISAVLDGNRFHYVSLATRSGCVQETDIFCKRLSTGILGHESQPTIYRTWL